VLAEDLGFKANYGISHNSGVTVISKIYPQLAIALSLTPSNRVRG